MTHKEMIERCQQRGYTARTGINPGFVKAISEWAKEKGQAVAKLIQEGKTKQAIDKLIEAQKLKRGMRELLNKNRDYFIYDKAGISIYVWEAKTQNVYALEH